MLNFKTWNQIRRSKQIISVLIKYGLDYFINQAKIGFWFKIRKKSKKFQRLTLPKKLRLALEELGPTFIKFGQILSTRPDFLPPDFIKELEKLQDKVPPFSSFYAQKIIEKELNKPLKKLFKKFESEPIAAASLSQVHKAILPNNKVVAVKIQRPGIKKTIELDLKILENLAGFLENRFYNGWVYQPKLIVIELKKAIEREIDFTNEAYNFERFRMNFKDTEDIKVPKIYWEMSTSKILTMEFMKGTKINEITQGKYKNVFDAKKVAKRGAQAILKQILEDGFFHADPHPANLLVQPPNTIIMLDVGMVGYLDEETIFKIAKLLQAIIDRNIEKIINCLENLGAVIKEVDRISFRQDLKELLGVQTYARDKYQGNEFAGVVTGLAWTSVGGEILFIEVALMPGKGNVILTGHLGEVMKELERIIKDIDEFLKVKDEVREVVIRECRDIIREAGYVVTYIHTRGLSKAKEVLSSLRKRVSKLKELVKDHPEIKYSGTVYSALSEYVEPYVGLYFGLDL